jgi:hypothetical protein
MALIAAKMKPLRTSVPRNPNCRSAHCATGFITRAPAELANVIMPLFTAETPNPSGSSTCISSYARPAPPRLFSNGNKLVRALVGVRHCSRSAKLR